MSAPIPAVAYYRMSTDRQEASIPEQREAVHAYAAKHSLAIIREYQDEGISGDATEKRAAFQRMLKDAGERADFEAVLCWDQDRFGRFDPLEAGYWIKPLRDASVRLETVAQGRIDWEDFAGRIVYAVQQEGKHAFLRDLSRNATRGMLRAARDGRWNGGPPPYGYRSEAGRLVPGDPAEVEIVRWLFHTYAGTDTSLGELARTLNERGVPGPGGRLWHKTSVQKILDCPLYLGDMVWNRRHEGRYHGVAGGEIQKERKGSNRRNRAEDWEVKPGSHEALIDRATWEAVQRLRVERRSQTTPHRERGTFLFTRLVYCMHCGSPMHGCTSVQPDRDHHGRIRSPKKYRYRRYICGRYNSHGRAGCTCNTITERQLRNAVVGRLQQDFLDRGNLERLKAELRRQALAGKRGDPATAASLRRQLAELDRKIGEGTERYLTAPTHLMTVLSGKLQEWQAQRERLGAELAAAERTDTDQRDVTALIDKAVDKLLRLREEIGKADPAKLRAVLHQLVTRVECWFDHVPYGRKGRKRSVLTRGLIHVRPDVQVSRDVPGGRPLTTV
jgi:DNA invertase Pin-like site-specific DNA recombinase